MSGLAPFTLGCNQCIRKDSCGGLDGAELFGCFSHCSEVCQKNTALGISCDLTCPNNEALYSRRWLEVRGPSTPRLAYAVESQDWPDYMPTIYSGYRRKRAAATAWAAVPLSRLIRTSRSGAPIPLATSPEELRNRLRLRHDTRILALGVDADDPIERLWSYHKTYPLGAWLKAMGITAATSPNFSYLAYAPREHYFWNKKRGLLFAKQLGESGFPVIPQLYGETTFDWVWWGNYFREHPLIEAVCIELQTSDSEKEPFNRLIENLERFRDVVGRPIRLVIAGGKQGLLRLAPLFPCLVIEATAYIKTIRRQLAHHKPDGDIRWTGCQTLGDLDPLFDHNVAACSFSVSAQIEMARGRTEKIQTCAA